MSDRSSVVINGLEIP